MAFDADAKKKIKDSMDYENGGHLSAVANKAAALDAPILIVGLGGTGADAVIQVKKMIYNRLKCEVSMGENKDKPKNIEYFVMDTDTANEKISLQGIGFNETLEECFIFTAPNVQKLLQNPLPTYIESWISKDISQEQVINGAGGVRQLGRLMLFMNLHRVISTLDTKIRRVTEGYPSNTPLYVFVVSGISGGTGSGTFIDIPYLIKAKVEEIDGGRPVNTIGILFLPDVNLSQPGLKEIKKENLKRNGFAALKELDYLMNQEKAGDSFKQDYGSLKVGYAGKAAGAPFDVCILMSSKDKNGIAVDEPYQYTLNVAAETIVNFIADEVKQKGGEFTINSFISNEVDDRTTFVHMMGENRHPINYVFSIAGASTAVLPMDDIMSYMTYLAFKEVDKLWNRIPSDEEVLDVLDSFGIEVRNLEMMLCQGSPARQNMQRHTYELIRQNPNLVIDEYNGVLSQQKAYVDSRMAEMAAEMEKRIDDSNNMVNQIFTDLNRGPIVAQRILSTFSDRLCVTKHLKEMNRFFLTNKPSSVQLEGLQMNSEARLRELLERKPLLPGGKTKLRDDFVKACDEYYDAQFRAYSYETLAELCVQYYNMFTDKNSQVYGCVADLLGTLVELFSKYGSIRTQKTEDRNASGGKTLTWSIIDTPAFIKELEKRMGKNDDLYVDLHSFITQFYTYLFNNSDIWTGREKVDVVESINQFISEAFEAVLDKSMDYYTNFIAMSQGKSLNQYCDDLFKKLDRRSNIMFPVAATYYTTVSQPGYSLVSVPSNAPQIQSSAKAHISQKSIIKNSEIKERIYMMNFESAVPLCAYADLSACHTTYVKLFASTPGLHLYESREVNWRELPSPYPETEWLAGHHVEQEAVENRRWREIFDKAKEYGYICWDKDKQEYVCRWGDPINAAAAVREAGVDPDAELNDFVKANRCAKILKAAVKNQDRLTKKKAIYDTKTRLAGDEMAPDDDFAKALFIKMVTVRGHVKTMVEDHKKALEIIDQLKKYNVMDELMITYLMLNYTGTITRRRGAYVYSDRQGMLVEFAALTGKQNNYPDYYLFSRLMAMDEKKRKDLINVCEKRYAQNQKTDEDFDKMQKELEDVIERLKGVMDRLNEEWDEIEFADGAAILQIYRSLYDSAKSELMKF
ncbi:MAG: hypothetical protein HFG70_00775 [Hungatella sp.]|nr:hypothetical protein [Hungatella sp.]